MIDTQPTLSSGGVSPPTAPPFMRRMVDTVVFVVLAMGVPGWITAKAELVPVKSATRNNGFNAIMIIKMVFYRQNTKETTMKILIRSRAYLWCIR